MRQHYEPYRPSPESVESLGFLALKRLCLRLQIPPPCNFASIGQTRNEIKKVSHGEAQLVVAHFLAEETARSMQVLAEHS